tara:strand:+ start:436 stop:783 length:348 start_codon:yes stop_codon:yes gene_type:complete
MAEYTDLFVDQGSNFSTTITVAETSGAATDLTGYSVRGQVRKSYTSTVATNFTASIASDPATGIVTISLSPAQTGSLKAGRYVYDVEAFIADSPETTVLRISEGQVHITPRVTQP